MADVTPLIPLAVARGGHVRTGLEDVALGSEQSNLDLVTATADAIQENGGTLATAADVRNALRSRPLSRPDGGC